MSCRPTKVSLLISYVIPVCTWIILCKPNPGFWCSFQTSAWTIFFSWKLMKVRSITCIYRQLIMIWPCSRGHIIILDYPIIKCVKIPKFQVVNPLQISSTVGLIWKITHQKLPTVTYSQKSGICNLFKFSRLNTLTTECHSYEIEHERNCVIILGRWFWRNFFFEISNFPILW